MYKCRNGHQSNIISYGDMSYCRCPVCGAELSLYFNSLQEFVTTLNQRINKEILKIEKDAPLVGELEPKDFCWN